MGKNGRSAKMYGKVVGKDSADRPGWKGPGYQKPKVDKAKAKPINTIEDETTPETGNTIPVELQQLLLNIFRDVFPDILTSDTLQPLLQDVKAALYDRDFNRAFGKSEYLEAYSVRWSPCRALCYQSILIDVQDHFVELLSNGTVQPKGSDSGSLPADGLELTLRVACFGGGAAELIAFGGFIRYLQDICSHRITREDDEDSVTKTLQGMSMPYKGLKVDLLLLDVAQWQDVVQKLHSGLITPPTISKYASAAAKEANAALITDGVLSTRFGAEDVFEMSQKQLKEQFGQTQMLLTILFTLNELYAASIGKTTAFLLNLTAAVKVGSLLLVVDSPGSYSETTVGSEAKKYPMQWLLNHTLLESQKSTGGTADKTKAAWTKVISDDSKWFRLHESLRYPIALENMRYQIHLYRRS